MHSTLVSLRVYDEAHKLKLRMQDEMNYYQGIYTYEAVITALANAFRGKGKKPIEYRTVPILEEMREKTPEEIRQERIAFVKKLERMRVNFQNSRGKSDAKH